jgi:transcriptional regulator with XRE-family HTH domain
MSESLKTSSIDQHVIDFVRKLRDERDITQEEIANIIGVKQSYIASIESSKSRAKYNLSHIDKLSDHFGISPRLFLPEKSTFK